MLSELLRSSVHLRSLCPCSHLRGVKWYRKYSLLRVVRNRVSVDGELLEFVVGVRAAGSVP